MVAIVVLVVALGVALCTLGVLGRNRAKLHAQRARLSHAARTLRSHSHQDDAVPLVVARYLEFALGQRRDPPKLVTLAQHGSLRTDVTSHRWLPFRATHLAAPGACAFIWNAEVAVGFGAHLRVVDSLLDGAGESRILFMSVLQMARDFGSSELNAGALQRFLAEAVWYPWALRPGNHLRWAAIDGSHAQASLTAANTTVSLQFRFAPTGEVSSIYTPGRWRRVGSHYVLTAWEGHFSNYLDNGGLSVPHRAEVGWYCDDRLELVWEGKVESVQHQY